MNISYFLIATFFTFLMASFIVADMLVNKNQRSKALLGSAIVSICVGLACSLGS